MSADADSEMETSNTTNEGTLSGMISHQNFVELGGQMVDLHHMIQNRLNQIVNIRMQSELITKLSEKVQMLNDEPEHKLSSYQEDNCSFSSVYASTTLKRDIFHPCLVSLEGESNETTVPDQFKWENTSSSLNETNLFSIGIDESDGKRSIILKPINEKNEGQERWRNLWNIISDLDIED